jgi:hypothetical protein
MPIINQFNSQYEDLSYFFFFLFFFNEYQKGKNMQPDINQQEREPTKIVISKPSQFGGETI